MRDLLNAEFNYHRNGYFWLVFVEYYVGISDEIRYYPQLLWLYMTNLEIIYYSQENFISVVQVSYVNSEGCSEMAVNYLTFWVVYQNEVSQIGFPENPRHEPAINMYGCNLIVATWSEPPYIYLEIDESKGTLLFIYGIEGDILRFLSEKIHFTMSIVAPPNNEKGYITDATNASGALAMVCIARFY